VRSLTVQAGLPSQKWWAHPLTGCTADDDTRATRGRQAIFTNYSVRSLWPRVIWCNSDFTSSPRRRFDCSPRRSDISAKKSARLQNRVFTRWFGLIWHATLLCGRGRIVAFTLSRWESRPVLGSDLLASGHPNPKSTLRAIQRVPCHGIVQIAHAGASSWITLLRTHLHAHDRESSQPKRFGTVGKPPLVGLTCAEIGERRGGWEWASEGQEWTGCKSLLRNYGSVPVSCPNRTTRLNSETSSDPALIRPHFARA